MNIDTRKLESLMASKMLTAKKLSEKSGVSEYTITKIKNGHRNPRPITLGKLASALGVDATEIIKN